MGRTRRRNGQRNGQKIRLIAALVILLTGLFLRFFSLAGMRFSFYVCCGLVGLLLLWSAFDAIERRLGSPVFGRTLKAILLLLILAGSAAFSVAEGFVLSGAHTEQHAKADCVLVLGAGVNGTTPSLALQSRLDAAAVYLKENPELSVVVSGGQGPGEAVTEAAVMETELIRQGIDADRIYREEQSRTTEENMLFSKSVMEKTGILHETVAVVSNEFHLYRAGQLAKAAGLHSIGVAAKTPYLMLRINYFMREACALLRQAAF